MRLFVAAGHLTLARRRRGGRRFVHDEPIDTRFEVTEIVLYSSTLSSQGATHTALSRVPLGGG